MLKEKVQQLASELRSSIVDNRRHLHAHPELSFQEYQTSAFVKEKLDQLEIAWSPMANTGIVAMIEGSKSSD